MPVGGGNRWPTGEGGRTAPSRSSLGERRLRLQGAQMGEVRPALENMVEAARRPRVGAKWREGLGGRLDAE